MRKWIEEKLMMMNNIRKRAVIVDTRASSVSDSMSSKEGQMTPSLQKKMPKKGGERQIMDAKEKKKPRMPENVSYECSSTVKGAS